MTKDIDFDKVSAQLYALRQGCQTLLLATVNADSVAELSYAPYVEFGGDFYIYVSELAAHTKNLLSTGVASIMFIENESEAGHLFARKRLIYQCQAVEIQPQDLLSSNILEKMEAKFGSLIVTLRSLGDFHLISLTPNAGQFVAGFGMAFSVKPGTNELVRIGPK